MSDEELDRLFKESAEQVDPPFDPEAWKDMDLKLEAAQTRSRYLKGVLSVFLLLVMISLLTVYKFSSSSFSESAQALSQTPASATTDVLKSDPEGEERNSRKQKKAILNQNWPGKTITKTNGIKNAANKLAVRNVIKKDVKTSNSISWKWRIPSPPAREMVSVHLYDSTDTELTKEEKQTEQLGEVTLLDVLAKDKAAELRGSISAGELAAEENEDDYKVLQVEVMVEDSLSEHFASATHKEDKQEKAQKEASYFFKSIQIALAVAPDFTTVNFRGVDGISVNGGLIMVVPITQKFSFVTGAVLANKVYSALPNDYSGAGGYYSGSGELTYIDATCKVLDLPLNIRYKVWAGQSSSVAVQTGISSYIMLSERYTSTYKYTSGYGDYYSKKTWEVENQNQHLFAVQNVSVVYSKALSTAFSVGAEPFAKIPLTGVGAGKIKLSSAGVFFSVGYSLGLRP